MKIRKADGIYGILMIIIGCLVAMYILKMSKSVQNLIETLFNR